MKKKQYRLRNYLLPLAAAVCVIAAAAVLFAVPRRGAEAAIPEAPAGYAAWDEDGNIVIRASDLSTDEISFLRFTEDSRIELIAIRDEDGKAHAALGTCQSCRGAPGAYYTQNGDQLQCNNCGLTFPLSVIGVSGAGCHPIMIDEKAIQRTSDGLVIDSAAIAPYEPLFATVAEHSRAEA